MLRDLDLGKDLWGKALLTQIYICNHFPSSTLPGNITPYEKVFGHAPSISHLHVFGSKCFIKVSDETQSKLDDKAKECQLIGYDRDSIYVVIDSNRKKSCSCNVIFMESQTSRNDNTESHLEFPSQTSETNDTKNTHTDAKDGAPRQRTRSEVWGTDPT